MLRQPNSGYIHTSVSQVAPPLVPHLIAWAHVSICGAANEWHWLMSVSVVQPMASGEYRG